MGETITLHPAALKEENERLHADLRRMEEEITGLRRKNRELHELAYHDKVTGLFSRIHLQEIFDSLEDKIEPVCLVMVDLDHFKKINDQYGHHIGDAVLSRFGAILKTVSHREKDVCVRWGGEEFAVLLRSCDLKGADVYVNRLLCRIREDLVIHLEEGPLLHATASIGIAERADNESMTALLRRADKAMYAAKHAGRDRANMAEAS